MKQFLALITILLLSTACQQQHVPEIAYDLDGISLMSQTRQAHKNILFKAKPGSVKHNQAKMFLGFVYNLKASSDTTTCVILKSNLGKELVFEADSLLAKKMRLNMDLIIRYTINKDKIQLVKVSEDI